MAIRKKKDAEAKAKAEAAAKDAEAKAKAEADAKATAEAETAAAEQGDDAPDAPVDNVEIAKQDAPHDLPKGAPAEDEDPQPGDLAPDGPKIAEMVMPVNMGLYRVGANWRGSLSGTICTLAKGKIINPRHYGGMGVLKSMRDAGCVLEEVKD